ncbi:(2Fe-2S)-binding protein [Streptacidiphilus sp. P02-A3a]|uniref:(2Fe-2S)-binding protein n=1 Tax=Streptacidiphilus sp. P02-A3a TaxID=2704468 RepID=UPI0015FA9BB0|nr:(2Fe-2S)-binding protein [Streptacidiphilus sp. P02-A3a]QMU71012.1 hypothetical protein GXP74_25115 [Streptacidiphilus sp. P02-A3a]
MSGTGFESIVALGPFFAFETHDPGPAPVEPWRDLRELVTQPGTLAARVHGVRAQLAARAGLPVTAVEPRVAASVAHLGLVARLLSPALATAAILGVPLPLGLDGLRWQPVPGGMFPLSVPRRPVPDRAVAPAELAALLGELLLDGPVRELAAAVRPFSVSGLILRGNAASALGGAVTVLAASPRTTPAQAGRARVIAARLLDHPSLRGAAEVDAAGRFRRRSCCLIYRAAPDGAGGFCGDCVLAAPRSRSRSPEPPIS